MMSIVRISSKGQVVIPKELRTKLGLEAGDYILMELEGDKVKLSKIQPIERFKGILKKKTDYSDLEEEFEEAVARGEV